MKRVPVVHSYFRLLSLYINDGGRAPINVQIVMNKVHIAENVGGGLQVSLAPQLSQSNIQLRQVEIIHNFLSNILISMFMAISFGLKGS